MADPDMTGRASEKLNTPSQENILEDKAEETRGQSTLNHMEDLKEQLSPNERHAVSAENKKLPPPPPPPKDDKNVVSVTSTVTEDQVLAKSNERLPDKTDFKPNTGIKPIKDGNRFNVIRSQSNMEIQNIMDQFNEGMGGPGVEEVMAQRAGITSPVLPPPRSSSLENRDNDMITSDLPSYLNEKSYSLTSPTSPKLPYTPTTTNPLTQPSSSSLDESSASRPQPLMYHPPLPEPDPEPELPFDFHRFLEQLRHRTADPVAKFLRSFLTEFGKKQWMVHEQVKIISDFLEFITKKMAQCEVWRLVSDVEFDNAREGMEKLVMNRLYSQTFSPAIPPADPFSPPSRNKGQQSSLAKVGRRGQHQEDVERDEVLAQKMRIYAWVSEDHLDIKVLGDKGRKFLGLAQQELLKINTYRAPRDKVICILNCCKVIFGFLRTSQSDQSADSFIPLLIYSVLRAKPEHLVSNVQYILRFRNQDKLSGEAGYYISSLSAAVQFIETIDRTSLTVSDEEFEKNVESAVSVIAEGHDAEPQPMQPDPSSSEKRATPSNRLASPHRVIMNEKSTISRPEVTPRNSLDAERIPPRFHLSPPRGRDGSGTARASGSTDNAAGVDDEGGAAVAGLLRSIQRPLSTIGRMFTEEPSSMRKHQQQQQQQPISTRRNSADPPDRRKRSEDQFRPQPGAQSGTTTRQRRRSSEGSGSAPANLRYEHGREREVERSGGRHYLAEEDAAVRRASAELAEAERIQRAEHRVIVDTLAGMFPDLDRDVIDDVVRLKEGRVGLAVDACLALSN